MDKVDHISLPELDEAEKEVEEDVELDLDDDEMIILKKKSVKRFKPNRGQVARFLSMDPILPRNVNEIDPDMFVPLCPGNMSCYSPMAPCMCGVPRHHSIKVTLGLFPIESFIQWLRIRLARNTLPLQLQVQESILYIHQRCVRMTPTGSRLALPQGKLLRLLNFNGALNNENDQT
ncbi:hypothetical protein Tco_0746949 [Tanacetum coccineum]